MTVNLIIFFYSKQHSSTQNHNCSQFDLNDRKIVTNSKSSDHLKCNYCKSTNFRLEMTTCELCLSINCLQHRHPEAHDCLKLKREAEQLTRSIMKAYPAPKGIKGAKNEALAKKVNLMKLKQTAIGLSSLPYEERYYMEVEFVNTGVIKKVFVSHYWTVGKCIDFLADKFRIINENNKPNCSKLILSLDTDHHFPFNVTFKELLDQNKISNGDKFLFRYLSNK